MRRIISWRSDESDLEIPVHRLLDVVSIPTAVRATPWSLMARRFAYALALIIAIAFVSYLDKGGYSEDLTFIDALYYSAVTLSTTGYGDIT
ncbi:potassium channel family protein, partial [Corynebacterium jeddahense]